MSGKLPFWGGVAAGAAGSALAIAGVKYIQGQRQISRDVDAFREHWAEPRAQHPDDGVGREHPEGVVHYVALGDSAAQGVGASHVGASYVALLGRRISLATGRSVAITNLSVSGAISGDVVAGQLPALAELGFEPDIVTLDIGGNDVIYPGHNAATFERSLEVILAALPEGSFVADVPWFMVPGLGKASQRMSVLASALVERHGHHLVPLHRTSRETGVLGYHLHTAGDFFHPNDRGYEGWAEAFWGTIVASGRVELLRSDD